MTREEAFEQMLMGKKITHDHFMSDEYYHIPKGNDVIIAEDGVNHTRAFWDQDFKKDGWEVYNH